MAVIEQVVTDRFALYNGDAMEVMPKMPEGSVHMALYSPPFGGLYHYSSSERDLSNADSYADFFHQYEFFVRELFRVTMPGRINAVHCVDIPSGNSGCDHVYDFPGDIIRLHTRCRDDGCTEPTIEREQGMCGHGWFTLRCRHHVWKEPLGVRNRTMKKNLAHRTVVDDSALCGNASADQLLIFQRRGENPIPIEHPQGLMEYAGSLKMPADLLRYRGWKGKQTENRFSHWIWRRYADAFWDDVRLNRVLPYQEAKDEEDEKHVHPLQLDVIDRAITLRSNPGETVFTPFMGVGSEVYGAVRLGRKGVGVELKPTYYRQAVKNLETVDEPEPEQSDIEEYIDVDTVPASEAVAS